MSWTRTLSQAIPPAIVAGVVQPIAINLIGVLAPHILIQYPFFPLLGAILWTGFMGVAIWRATADEVVGAGVISLWQRHALRLLFMLNAGFFFFYGLQRIAPGLWTFVPLVVALYAAHVLFGFLGLYILDGIFRFLQQDRHRSLIIVVGLYAIHQASRQVFPYIFGPESYLLHISLVNVLALALLGGLAGLLVQVKKQLAVLEDRQTHQGHRWSRAAGKKNKQRFSAPGLV